MKPTSLTLLLLLSLFSTSTWAYQRDQRLLPQHVSQIFDWQKSHLSRSQVSLPALTYRNRQGRADGRISGGGKLVNIKGSLFLRDFVEAGIEATATVNMNTEIRYPVLTELKAALSFEPQVLIMIEVKINEIYELFPLIAIQIMQVIQDYDWNVVNAHVCDPDDVGPSPLSEINNFQDIPVACRENRFDRKIERVTFNRHYLSKLNNINLIGTFFHEVFHILDNPFHSEDFYYRENQKPSSESSRQLTSFIFDPRFKYTNASKARRRFEALRGLKSSKRLKNSFFITLAQFEKVTSAKHQCRQLRSKTTKTVSSVLRLLQNLERYKNKRHPKHLHYWRSFPRFSLKYFQNFKPKNEFDFFSDRPQNRELFVLENYPYYKRQEIFGQYIKSQHRIFQLPRKSLRSLSFQINNLNTYIRKDHQRFFKLCFTQKFRHQLEPIANIKVHINNR